MTRRDQGIIGALLALFAVLAIVIAVPAVTRGPEPASSSSPRPGGTTAAGSVAGSGVTPSAGADGTAGAAASGQASGSAAGGSGAGPSGGSPAPSDPSAAPASGEASSAPTGSSDPAASSPSPDPSVDLGSTIRQGVVGEPTSINPLTARTQADRDLAALVFSGLVRLGPGDDIAGDLADHWKVDGTGKHWTFHIRPDATWHDGQPVTADDVVFTIRLLRDPGYHGPFIGSWNEIVAKKVDASTVRFDLRTPLGDFLQLARQPLLPAHLLAAIPVQALTDSAFSAAPVGAGPYRLLQWDSTMARLAPAGSASGATTTGGVGSPTAPSGSPAPSDSAAPSDSPTPSASSDGSVPGLEFRFYPNATALADAYRRGEVDIADGLPAPAALGLQDVAGTRILRYPRATLTSVLFNLRTNHPTVRDQQTRQALLMAIDRVALVNQVMSGMGNRADTLVPPSSWAYVKSAARAMPYSTQRAAALLKADGWRKVNGKWHPPGSKNIFTIEILTTTKAVNPIAYASAQFVAQSWRSFGVTVTVRAMAPVDLVNRLSGANFTAGVVDMNIGLDPDLYPLLASRQAGVGGSNISGVQSLVLDDLLVAARTPGPLAARRGAWAKLERFLSDAQVILPLAFRDDPLVISSRVQGPQPRLLGDLSDRFWDVLTWRLASAG